MDPLSTTASIIAILQLTAHVSSYVSSCKNASQQQAKLAIETSNLFSLLTNLRFRVEEAQSNDSWFNEVKLLNRANGPLEQFKLILEELVDKLQLTDLSTPASGIKASLTWKLNKGEVNELLQQIERLKSLIGLALAKDHFALSQATHAQVDNLAQDLQAIRLTSNAQRVQEITKWLNASDPTTNYDAARRKHLSGTGSWLLLEPAVEGWKQSQSQLIWLRGTPGCGKTILSSTLISDLDESVQQGLNTVVTSFFFDFSDLEKQTTGNLTKSLLTQICYHDPETLEELGKLHDKYIVQQKSANESELSTTLKDSLLRLSSCHIVLDALDESSTRQSLLSFIKVIKEECCHVRLFVTSRNEKDMEEVLSDISDHMIEARNTQVDEDICSYVKDCLETFPRLKKWPPNVKQEIETALTKKADGMQVFQWVNCQIEVLEKCLHLNALRRTLNLLPESLHATYERIIESIDANGYLDDALRILRWLCFAVRPLTLVELIDILATSVSAEDTGFSQDNRLLNPHDVRLICANLITFTETPGTTSISTSAERISVVLAHNSVREYLLSTRFRYRSLFEETSCHIHIAETCLLYLHAACTPTNAANAVGSPRHQIIDDYPFLGFARHDSRKHLQQSRSDLAGHIMQIALQLLLDEATFRVWLRNEFEEDCGLSWRYDDHALDFEAPLSQLPGRLFCAVCLGSEQIVRMLMENGEEVNPPLALYQPLNAAAWEGYDRIVQVLLENGATDHVVDDDLYDSRSSAIIAAMHANHHSTVEILLNQAPGPPEYYEYAIRCSLDIAPDMTHMVVSRSIKHVLESIVLIDYAVRKEFVSGLFSELLLYGSEDDITILIETIPIIDFHQGGKHNRCPVSRVAEEGKWGVLLRLLNKGGGIRAISEQTTCAFIAAAQKLQMEVMSELLHNGADANGIASINGTALNAVIRTVKINPDWIQEYRRIKYLDFVNLLFEYGSDPNIRAGAFWLEPPFIWPGEEAFDMNGENCSGLGKFKGSPLQFAIQADDAELVQLLLEKGADSNLADDPLGSAFLTALVQGKSKVLNPLATYDKAIAKSFLRGETVNFSTNCERFNELARITVSYKLSIADALTLATKSNRLSMVRALLCKSAKLEQGINGYLPSLGIAIFDSRWDILEALIDHGADLGMALLLAVESCREYHVQWILEQYAVHIKALGPGILTKALREAIHSMYPPIISRLLDSGADVDMIEDGQSAMDRLLIIISNRELSDEDVRVISSILPRSCNDDVKAQIEEVVSSQ